MAVYLVDTENTAHWWGSCQKAMRRGDRIILFYTRNSRDLNFEQFNGVSDLDILVQFVKCGHGSPNALDFQLISYMGYLISEDPGGSYYIIANDAGYDAAVAFWQARGVDVLRLMFEQPGCRATVSGKTGVTAVWSDVFAKLTGPSAVRAEFGKLLPDELAGELDDVCELFEGVLNGGFKDRLAIRFRNALTGRYGLERGSDMYRVLRPYAAEALKFVPEPAGTVTRPDSGTSGTEADDVSGGTGIGSRVFGTPKQDTEEWDWARFRTYVNEQRVCGLYRNSLEHDYKFVDRKLGAQIMAVMAYAMTHVPEKKRIESVMRALGPSIPKGTSKKDVAALRSRLARKMSSGKWPDELTGKPRVRIRGVPNGL